MQLYNRDLANSNDSWKCNPTEKKLKEVAQKYSDVTQITTLSWLPLRRQSGGSNASQEEKLVSP